VSDADPHIVKARESLKFARSALAGEYTEEAGRSAYMAALSCGRGIHQRAHREISKDS
jgi:hypothetical protein